MSEPLPKIKPYLKKLPYTYAFGVYPVLDLFKHRPESILKIILHPEAIERLFQNNQVVLQYADSNGTPAGGRWPLNPNGSLFDIAGICDPTGRIFGLMPHPEAFNHFTNHPDWTRRKLALARQGKSIEQEEGGGIGIFRNAVDYFR